MKTRTSLFLLALAVLALVAVPSARADTIYWDGTGTGWDDVTYWSTAVGAATPDPVGVPGASDVANFSISTITNTAQTVNLNAAQSAAGLIFLGTNTATTTLLGGGTDRTLTLGTSNITVNSLAGAVTVGSATSGQNVAITLGGAQSWTNNSANALTIQNAVTNGSNLLTVAGTGNTTINGAIGTGAGGLTKSDGGILTLSGANIYTGTTTVSGGTLRANDGTGLPTGSLLTISSGVFETGANLARTGGSAAGNMNITTGTSGFSAKGGAVQVAFGTLGSPTALTWGTAPFQPTILVLNASTADNTLEFKNAISLVNSARTVQVDANVATMSGVLSGTGGGLTKAGAGTLTLSGANTYTGATTISAGTLKLGAAGDATNTPLGTTAAGTTVSASGAALDLNGFTLGTAEALTLNSTGVSSGGALTNSSATAATYSGLITLGSASSIVASSGNIVISNAGTITGSGFGLTLDGTATGSSLASIIGTVAGTVTKSGTGTWTLSGANTYTGVTTVNAGILQAGSTTAFGPAANASLTFGASSTGKVQLNNNSMTVIGLNTNATVGTPIVENGTAGTATLTVNNAAASTYAGVLQDGSAGTLALTKSGAGTLTLSGVNTYGGTTTVSAGTLKLGAAGVIPDGSGKGNVSVTGTLDLNTYSETINGLSGAGTVDNLAAGTPTLTVGNNDQTSIFTGVIKNTAGTLALTKTGTGTLILSGTNTYAGATTVNAGTLRSSASNVLPDASNVTVSGTGTGVTATLDLHDNSDTIGTLSFGGSTTTSGAAVATGTGTLTLGGNVTYTATNNPLGATISGKLALGATRTFTIGDSTSAVNDLTVSAVISGSTFGLTKAGAGTLLLSGANTYTGATTISAGTLSVGANANLGNANALVLDGGTLQITGTALTSYASGLIGTHAVTQTADKTIGLDINNSANTFTVSTALTQVTGGLTKTGFGTLVLSGTNTYTGATTVNAGTLRSGANDVLPNASNVTVSGNAAGVTPTLNLNGYSDTIGTLSFGGSTATSGAAVATGAGTLTLGGNVTYTATNNPLGATISGNLALGATRTFTIGDSTTAANDLTVSAVISGSTFGLTKAGAGTLLLSGANTYTGVTTLSAGTLVAGRNAFSGSAGAFGNATSEVVLGVAGGNDDADILTNGAFTVGRIIRLPTSNTTDAGTRVLTLGGSTASNSIFSGNIFLGTTDQAGRDVTLHAICGGQVTFSGVIQDPTGMDTTTYTITKTGFGTVVLSGNNTYTGATTVSEGTLTLGRVGGTIKDTAAVTVSGGTLNVANAETVGAVTLSSGTISGVAALTGSSYSLTDTGTVSAVLAGSGIALTKTGAGTATLSAANTYTGATTISAGTLVAGRNALSGSAGAFGNATSEVVLGVAGGNDAADILINGAFTVGRIIRLPTSNTTDGGTRVLSLGGSTAGNSIFSGNIFLGTTDQAGRGVTLTAASGGQVTFSGVIQEPTGMDTTTYTITKAGSGTVVLSGANTYTGATTVSAGTLVAGTNVPSGSAGAFGNATSEVVLGVAGGYDAAGILTNGAFTVGRIIRLPTSNTTDAGTRVLTLGGNTAVNSIFSGNIFLGTTSQAGRGVTLTAASGGQVTFSGVIQDPTSMDATTYTITKAGLGTVVLSGANTYTGQLTVEQGVLNVATINNASADGVLGNSALAVILGKTGGLTGTLQYTGGTASSTKPFTMATGGTGAFQVDTGAAVLTLSGLINGSGALTKTGAGGLTLSSAKTYTGDTKITAGTLALSNNLALQNSAIDTSGAGVVTLNVTTPTFGGLKGSKNLASVITTGYSSVTSLTLNPGTGVTDTYSGVIANGATGMTLTKTGAGTQVLSGANTYTGATTVSAGTLVAGTNALSGSAGAFGNATSEVVLGVAGGNDDAGILTNGAFTVGRIIRLPTSNTTDAGTRVLTLGGNTASNSIFSGNIFLGTTSQAGRGVTLTAASGGQVTFSGVIQDPTSMDATTYTITKAGLGTVVLSGNNTYTGATTVSAGTLKLGRVGGTILDTAAVTVSGGTLNVAIADTVGAVTLSSGTISGVAALTGSSYSLTGSGTVSAVLAGSGIALTKTGGGTTTILSAANTYTGNTTITSGTLKLTGWGRIASSPIINVASGAFFDVSTATGGYTLGSGKTLKGSGTVTGAMTIGSGSTLSPGGSPGTLTVNNGIETWAGGGIYAWQLLDATGTAGTGWDLAAVTGTGKLAITATSLNKFNVVLETLSSIGPDVQGTPLNWNAALEPQSWKIASSANAITGWDVGDGVASAKFAIDATNFVGEVSGALFTVSKTGNNVYLNYSYGPEPATLSLLGLGGLSLILRRKRR